MTGFEHLPYDIMFIHKPSGMIKCGQCWNDDVLKTLAGEYTGDEAVNRDDIFLADNTEPIQCEGCNKQNDAYEALGEEA